MKVRKKVFTVLLSVGLMLSFGLTSSAEQLRSTDSFTHQDTRNGKQISVAMPDVYRPIGTVDASSLSLKEGYGPISDIACDEQGHCFVLSEDGVIVEFDENFQFVSYRTALDVAGKEMDFAGARGIYVREDELYIADTMNARVLCLRGNQVIKEIVLPESSLIPSDFVFSPTKVAKDSKGYIYVISEGSYYGAVMYSPQGVFLGFYGANTVKGGVLSTLETIWDSLTRNDIKRAKTVKTLPFQFVDICIDKNDFVYTCTGITSQSNASGQIRMLSPGGTNILFRRQYNGVRTGASSFVFGETDQVKRLNKKIVQDFENVQVDKNGFLYALDSTYGLIYVYDTDCNLLTAFGGGRGTGTQTGVFASATALAVCKDRVYVADSQYNNVTVFSLTEFGYSLLSAQRKTLDAAYAESRSDWEYVLKRDAYNQLAMRGMAKISYINGDYENALRYAEEGLDYVIYGQALSILQTKWITRNFTWLFCGVILITALIVTVVIYKKKKGLRLIQNHKIKVFLGGFIHPFEAYSAVRYQNMGSVKITIGMMAAFFVSSVLAAICSNFRYTSFDEASFSSLFQILKTIGLILLWSLANWGISVLLQGIGKFKHVLIVTSYSVLPLVICNFVSVPLSYLITSPTSTLMSGLNLVAMIWTGIVLTIGLMQVHNFTFPRFAASVAGGLFFMVLILLVAFIFGILITQLGGFVITILMEAIYR